VPSMNQENGKNGRKTAKPEVPARATRRTFTREYKLAIVREAEEARKNGGLGALLRREGLYSSTLVQWRREFPSDGEVSLQPKLRGPKPRRTPGQKALEKLERENGRLRKKLAIAQALLELQKKAQAVLADLEDEEGSR
jgi:transposase